MYSDVIDTYTLYKSLKLESLNIYIYRSVLTEKYLSQIQVGYWTGETVLRIKAAKDNNQLDGRWYNLNQTKIGC